MLGTGDFFMPGALPVGLHTLVSKTPTVSAFPKETDT